MKTPHDWSEKIYDLSPEGFEMLEVTVKKIQTEAWNEAIEAAAENAQCSFTYKPVRSTTTLPADIAHAWVNQESILKLKI